MLQVGFTGTQKGMKEPQRETFKRLLFSLYEKKGSFTLHHGDCVGADEEAHEVARALRCSVYLHPPTNRSKRAFCKADWEEEPYDYLYRNLRIVEASDILIATPMGMREETRSGTWSTVRKARKKGKTIFIVFPDGSLKKEAA